ncbi:MAG: YggT family protein [Pseudomonadota bacterium]|nr:YggT family protein [Pseudomonadota bacterium]
MGANTSNAMLFLVTTFFDLLLWAFMLRILLQAVRADFYNPVSQLIWKVTRYPTDWMRPFVPNLRNVNSAAAIVVALIAVIYVYSIFGIIAPNGTSLNPLSALWYALLKIVVLLVNLFTFSIFIQAIMSWLGPGVSNPASNVLFSINEPLLRPARRIIPPLSGLDLSPMVVIVLLQVLNRLLPLPGAFR